MTRFYFSRSCGPNPFASKYLISGVINAPDLDGAKGQLSALLHARGSTDGATSFTWADLSTVEQSESGLLAITMGERS